MTDLLIAWILLTPFASYSLILLWKIFKIDLNPALFWIIIGILTWWGVYFLII